MPSSGTLNLKTCRRTTEDSPFCALIECTHTWIEEVTGRSTRFQKIAKVIWKRCGSFGQARWQWAPRRRARPHESLRGFRSDLDGVCHSNTKRQRFLATQRAVVHGSQSKIRHSSNLLDCVYVTVARKASLRVFLAAAAKIVLRSF